VTELAKSYLKFCASRVEGNVGYVEKGGKLGANIKKPLE
jgi:hypothetical protein